jgi:tetratricopeptide (TPR) repeat protein
MRSVVHLALCGLAFAQSPDPYAPLRARDYDAAIAAFRQALAARPDTPHLRKDLAYTYLKIGENGLARDQFKEAMRLDPADLHVALEYAFLSYEAKAQAEARRIFDRIRKSGDPIAAQASQNIAERAFQNIDAPLAAGIERWTQALARGGPSFSGHFELATLAEQRDRLDLAAEHYEKAWRLQPDRRSVLVDLGRVWQALGRTEDATAALLAASRGGEPRAAEMARELLPPRYPFIPEFRRALELDPASVELRRELAYLLLRMDRQPEAEAEFATLAPRDLLASTQLGFLLHARGERLLAQPHFDRVLAGGDEDLANRVRAVLRMPQILKARPSPQPLSIDARLMAERSIKAGYLKDAVKYLEAAHEADPADHELMLKLGWTLNILREDRRAVQWFNLARKSADPRVASEAGRAWKNLRPSTERFRISGWLYPMYSTRWSAAFSYGQAKVELRAGWPVRPYVSARLVGDSALLVTQSLSERSVILALGLTTPTVHGARAWFEAGNAIGYTTGRMLPDYRGGLAFARAWRGLAETAIDALYVSRFNKDFLVYHQTRFGRLAAPLQLYWNANVTFDSRREYWANFVETGPGVRVSLVPSTFFTLNLLRGAYLVNTANPRRPNFTDLRAGLWYAFSY